MIAIIAVGYNRPNSMSRLLQSICAAEFYGDAVDLIVSIDKSDREADVVNVAEKVDWPYGNKIIRTFEKRQGLRKHILQCGDYTNIYDAVIVLEDDLVVSESFYLYVKNAVQYYENDSNVAGISLYSYFLNEFCEKSFIPAYNGYDTFMIQVAQSWGECWTKSMWQEFRAWPYADAETIPTGDYMPSRVFLWGASSWKKNFMAYLAQEDKFFVYPYFSYTTNCSEAGTHRRFASTNFQVPIVEKKRSWVFSPFSEAVKYDAFFERMNVKPENYLFLNKTVVLDLYGLRNSFSSCDYVVSSQDLPYEVIQTIGLSYRPHEMNYICMTDGAEFSIYDIHKPCKSKHRHSKDARAKRYEYYALSSNWNFCLKYYLYGLKRALLRKRK